MNTDEKLSLSELVGFRNRLNNIVTVDGVKNSIDDICTLIENTNVNSNTHKEQLSLYNEKFQSIKQQLDSVSEDVANHNKLISEELERVSKKFYASNYDLELAYDSAQSIRDGRQLTMSNKADEMFRQRIKMYVDWRFPILELGCRDGDMTNELVAGDPLYIVDNYQEFIDNTLSKFNDQYKNRVRPYLIQEESGQPNILDIQKLPIGQFGFIFSFNYFNYRSIQGLKDYLGQAKELLRPGGAMMFTYNNSDLEQQAAFAESYFMSYMPKSLLIPLCQSVGFDYVTSFDIGNLSWIEIRIPGELESIKAHQAMAKIVHIEKYPKELTFE